MKQMILTGLATEQKFGNPEPQFYLVFNEGQLRVPVSSEGAEVVIQAMYGSNGVVSPSVETEDEDSMHTDHDGFDNEESIPQA